ncbi:hypothetical protein VITFI_CDS2029 [Vitreoscilla filiformis]|jgi:hypothetical protein|uniref:PhoU domain-containing protein n=1 Tax=Vitreoscilla filiformis TaxID=63 RepID=A0A221KG26_VITFI|nr:hypothetical protein [Vitreoscilla filiformis]ASM77807.1 hypothetical protein VITFI_CDS2029 [Vitreoscilla filiformis]
MPLATAADVERFADLLTECADAIHQRLIAAIRAAEVNPFTAQQILQDEATLRQRANGLYMDAAQCIVADLGDDQINLNEVIREAGTRITEISKIAHFIDIVSDLLVVVSSVYAAQPGPILAALHDIQQDIDTIT